ncbi:J domain-containing protein [Sinomonas atrocyanea]
MPAHVPSHYEVLGVPVTASEGEIRRAYRRAARAHHPDHGGDVVEFRRVTLAFEVLSDPRARAAYDRSYFTSSPQREEGRPAEGAGAASSAEGRPGAAGFTARPAPRAGGQRNPAGEPAVYVPPFEPGTVPLLPAAVAARAEHGVPRRRGLFGAEARIQREERTAALIRRRILGTIPSARLLNGLRSPGTPPTWRTPSSPATGLPSSTRCSCPGGTTRGTARTSSTAPAPWRHPGSPSRCATSRTCSVS